MTTNEDYIEYFSGMLDVENINPPDKQVYLAKAVQQGIKELWYASNWPFRYSESTMDITAGSESYDMPNDFASLISLRETTTNRGFQLVQKSPEEFDRLIPKQTAYASGTPQMFKLFGDADKKWHISFFPQPDAAITLGILYLTVSPTKVDSVPKVAHAALEPCIAKHVYPYSHQGRIVAAQLAESEIAKLEITSKSNQAPISIFPTSSEGSITGVSETGFFWTN